MPVGTMKAHYARALLQLACKGRFGVERSLPLLTFPSFVSRQNYRRIDTIFSAANATQITANGYSVVNIKDLENALGPLSSTPTVPPPSPLVVVISGPSGVGKDAVIRRLQEKRPDLFFVVTATSRPMRPGEQHGVDYFFVTKGQFEEWLEQGVLLEHAIVYGEYKGIPKQQVTDALDRGTDVFLRIDVQGSKTVRELLPGTISIFLVAENELELVERLVSRKTEPLDKMLVRVQTAKEETSRLSEFDYVVVNRCGQLEETVNQIEAILVAEKSKVQRYLPEQSSSP